MKEALREKINNLTRIGVESEAECVYLLSQIRKYIEQQDLLTVVRYSNPGLFMCMNWVLHKSIDRAVDPNLIQEIEQFLRDKDFLSKGYNFEGYQSLLNRLLFVETLRGSLLLFLEENAFDTTICYDDDKYNVFLKFFGKVIEDSPLEMNKGSQDIQQIFITKVSGDGEHIRYKWTVVTSDKGTVELNPFQD